MHDDPVDLGKLLSDDVNHYATGARAAQLRWCEQAVFADTFTEDKWQVPEHRDSSWTFDEAFDAADLDQAANGAARGRVSKQGAQDLSVGQVVHEGTTFNAVRVGSEYAFRKDPSTFVWKGRHYKLSDYKSRRILVPEDQMWGWYTQRKIVFFTLTLDQDESYDRVVFGTKDDAYTAFPEKYGFKGRRTIIGEPGWKKATYEARLADRNPRRGHVDGKMLMGVSDAQKQNRWDEINEESGLRVKHAPCILMKNRYLTDHDSFVTMYLTGSQGTGAHAGSRARPDHVTDHEIYRMFSGKYRRNILSNTLFAGEDLKIIKVGKTKNNWWNKNQISRWWRIWNQN